MKLQPKPFRNLDHIGSTWLTNSIFTHRYCIESFFFLLEFTVKIKGCGFKLNSQRREMYSLILRNKSPKWYKKPRKLRLSRHYPLDQCNQIDSNSLSFWKLIFCLIYVIPVDFVSWCLCLMHCAFKETHWNVVYLEMSTFSRVVLLSLLAVESSLN